MRRHLAPRLVLALLIMALAAPVRAQDDARNAHGTFTGEIKPVIYVTDVEKSAPFYRDTLGFGFEGFADSHGQPYYAEMTAAGVKFGLHEAVSEADKARIGRQRLYFRVTDLQAQRTRVGARGGAPGEIEKTAWMDMFTVRDPDGNEIVFALTDPAQHSIDPWKAETAAGDERDAPGPAPALDWLEGDWHGVRRDAAGGEEAPITVHVESLQGGARQVERLQVRQADGSTYTGFAVLTPAERSGRWRMLYANSTRTSFSRLEGEVERDRVTWHSVTPGRSRTSHVVVERLGPDRWRRTNEVSEDGGKTWRVLFIDEVERSR